MSCGYPLSEVIAEICQRAGLPYGYFSSSSLGGVVDGFFITNESSAIEHIETLAQAHFFDCVGKGDYIDFVHRGGPIVAAINSADSVSDGFDEVVRKSPESIVQVLNLNYYDLNGSIDTDKQTSDRSIDTRSQGEENITTPLVLETSFAAQRAVIMHKVMIEEQRGEKKLTLPDSYLFLTVGDCIAVDEQRYRITEININSGYQDYTLVYDRKSAYESNAIGIAPIPLPPAVSQFPGETLIEFIDTTILDSRDDWTLGYYIAIAGQNPAWAGAVVELSIDGGQNYLESDTSSVEAAIGELVTPLAAHKPWFFDGHNTCTVKIKTSLWELESVDYTAMLNRANRAIIGNEIINFSDAVEIGPGEWEISGLLRGRLGTNATAHDIGERFVLLTRSDINYLPTEIFNIGQPLTFRASSINGDEQVVITHTYNGNSQRELAPAYLRVRRVDENLLVEWIGVGRIGGRGAVSMGQFFTGYRLFDGNQNYDTQDQFFSVPYTGQTQISVCQLNSFTGEGEWAHYLFSYDVSGPNFTPVDSLVSREIYDNGKYPSQPQRYYGRLSSGWMTNYPSGSLSSIFRYVDNVGIAYSNNYVIDDDIQQVIFKKPGIPNHYWEDEYLNWCLKMDVINSPYIYDIFNFYGNHPASIIRDLRDSPDHIVVAPLAAGIGLNIENGFGVKSAAYTAYSLHVLKIDSATVSPPVKSRTMVDEFWRADKSTYQKMTGDAKYIPPLAPTNSPLKRAGYGTGYEPLQTNVIFGELLYYNYHRPIGVENTLGKPFDVTNALENHFDYATATEICTARYSISSSGDLTALDTRSGYYMACPHAGAGVEVLCDDGPVWSYYSIDAVTGERIALLGTTNRRPAAMFSGSDGLLIMSTDGVLRKYNTVTWTVTGAIRVAIEGELSHALMTARIHESINFIYVAYCDKFYWVAKLFNGRGEVTGFNYRYPGYADIDSNVIQLNDGVQYGLATDNPVE